MSRKAVQGYPEKSYYDNTRFLGVIATSDPLNEGYFKHLVNFDIADTGMSVRPRKGYLTTTLRHTTLQQEYVSMSTDTVIFKDENIQAHIIYDFSNNKGYIADISAYSVTNKFISLTHVIANTDWSDVFTFIYSVIPGLEAALDGASMNDIQKSAYIMQKLFIYGDAKVVHITDINSIRKSLLKLEYRDDIHGNYIFFLEMYYREDEVPLLNQPEDTLVFSALDTREHPSYLSYERNIASPLSIIPERLQRLYTVINKPDGHVNQVGLVYVEDENKDYYINHIYPNTFYNFIPQFSLHSALQTYDNDMWAWAFDVVSTKKTGITSNALSEDAIFKSNWFKFQSENYTPTLIFERSNTYDLTNTDKTLRHYKNTKHILYLIPRDVSIASTSSTTNDGVWTPPTLAEFDYTTSVALYTLWLSELSNIKSTKSLKTALENLKDHARFYIKSLEDDASTDPELTNISSASTIQDNHNFLYVTDNTFPVSIFDKFLEAEDVIDLIDVNYFVGEDITYKLLPFLSKDTHTIWSGGGYVDTEWRWLCAHLGLFSATYSEHTLLLPRYNLYNGTSQQTFIIPRTLEDLTEIKLMGVSTTMLRTVTDELPNLASEGVFDMGYTITFYIRPYDYDEVTNKTLPEIEVIKNAWRTSAYLTSTQVTYGYDDLTVTTIPETLTKEPADIQNSTDRLVFEENRLIVWRNNIVYISEPGRYYYFKEENKKEFPEKVVKVIVFKTILLVFTVQNLYAIYQGEIDTTTVDDKGNVIPTTKPAWLSQPVLYNILASQKYADAIQVFNQMVLFYSEDGQMFMIKPNTMIDSETQFSLQYFNKSANDILLNYDIYINERLAEYNIDKTVTKNEVSIKVILSVNFIKIYYCVPGYITYILNYDVINNRYTIYDTITFTDIRHKLFIESGELLMTSQGQKMYLTMPYTEMNVADNMCDMSFVNSFKKIAINASIDTGNLNLNNHLRKRFKDLHITFKNLSASTLLLNVETMLDDVISHPFYNTQLEIQEINGVRYYITIPKSNENDLIELIDINQVSEVASSAFKYAMDQGLFENDNLLMDFSDYTSSKLLTHRSSILGMGRVFRIKMRFVSKGLYKIQDFGIVYKERRI